MSGVPIPEPPRLTGDKDTDSYSYLQWLSEFFKATVREGAFLTSASFAGAAAVLDRVLSNQSAIVSDTNLLFQVAANERWVAEFVLDVGATLSSTGIKLAVDAPADSVVNITAALIPDVVTAANRIVRRSTTPGQVLDFTAATLAGVSNAQIRVAVFIINGSTQGAVQLQYAQSTRLVTNLLVRLGSFLRADRITT